MDTEGGGSISPNQFVAPPEVGALKKNQSSTIVLGLGFARVLDRDRSLLARLEIKSDRGTNAIEIRPPLGEMLRPCRVGSDDFKGLFERMHGIHQRTTASISLTPAAGTTMRENWNVLPLQIQKHANLVGAQSFWCHYTCVFISYLHPRI